MFLTTGACASAPRGASWGVADFNKYSYNYAPFATGNISIGQSRKDMLAAIGVTPQTVEMGQDHEVLAFQKWKSVAGPDHVEQTLYVRLVNGAVAHWKLTRDVVVVVPNTW